MVEQLISSGLKENHVHHLPHEEKPLINKTDHSINAAHGKRASQKKKKGPTKKAAPQPKSTQPNQTVEERQTVEVNQNESKDGLVDI